ncbi:MAG: formate--tetrahydrofolate ligase [Bacilli bacterium]|nr:formate--tetrahydrofolate ligase [Bacilli bacterium]
MLSDIEISQSAKVEKINKIAEKLAINEDYLEQYGSDKAKINLNIFKEYENKPDGKLILVTAISPTPLGEGKSTTSIGLVDALCKLNKKALGALREPSLGPVFGVKGGAAGGGYAQINPMADLNLHFTGDLHAITAANNLISACLDNHIFQGNELNINPDRVVWQRCMDLNDRALREVTVAIEEKKGVAGRKERFNITVASEIMAILCLAKDINDLRSRVDNLILAYTYDDKVITVKDLGITGSVLVLLKDAMKPNLVQTLENNPILVHGGPFANIAHGCNSIIATRLGLKLADYLVTEAGFGADLGAEKFLDIKCREAGLNPSAVVLVATIKALKYHGGVDAKECKLPNLEALKKGIVNLEKHIDTLQKFGLPFVIALNRFDTDTAEELSFMDEWSKENNYPLALSEVFAKGGAGGIELAEKVIATCEQENNFNYLYDLTDSVEDKIFKIASKVYGAKEVVYKKAALAKLEEIKKTNYKDFYICMAKTPLSLTDNAKIVGAPKDFTITVKEIRVSAGAKFLVCLTGAIMTMPGLPKVPLANKIDIDEDNKIHNLS